MVVHCLTGSFVWSSRIRAWPQQYVIYDQWYQWPFVLLDDTMLTRAFHWVDRRCWIDFGTESFMSLRVHIKRLCYSPQREHAHTHTHTHHTLAHFCLPKISCWHNTAQTNPASGWFLSQIWWQHPLLLLLWPQIAIKPMAKWRMAIVDMSGKLLCAWPCVPFSV